MTELDQLRRRVEGLESALELISAEYIDTDSLLDILDERLANLDLDVTHDGERGLTFKVMRGNQVKDFCITIPAMIDKGTFQSGQSYVKGDCVSFGGQIWVAQANTSERPGGNEFWRLAVRHGKDLRSKKKVDNE